MPATAERPRPVHIPLLDDPLSRKRSPPPCTKLPDPASPSPPPSIPPQHKPPTSPRPEKKPAPPSSPSEPEPHKLDRSEPTPDSPSAKKPGGLKPEPDPASRSEQESAPVDPKEVPSLTDIIDMEVLNQIRELDDEDGDEFSREMVYAFFIQAEQTFGRMDDAFRREDVGELSSLGHFLKGSSAALGVSKVQSSCEQIQNYGNLRDEEASSTLDKKEALLRIGKLLTRVQKEYRVAEEYLKGLYPQ
ncbi:hypothetical protein Agabi119p4_7363 [Agaricus bisporus var. burnettii]|uniref:HPt domain-containing protein n=1 Tax=Agaricus bisporus var. burnettii TaxID=192524 RepID=A0A8H7C826_AGABI|nr:hypothetical protein Agabi119p4_7363 [Agaricus bisporus var. burnettii]